ncbi:MAG: putative small protein [Paenibacillus sp.]|jgi:hypothetical protein|nr:putative small protein [Paenibacillus sp.]
MTRPVRVDDIWLERIAKSVNGIEYGNVMIVIHDGRIVQIERTERQRFDQEASHKLKTTKHAAP